MPQTADDEKRVTLKVPEAAKIAGCGEKALRRAIAEGKVPHLRFGRNIILPRLAFLNYINSAGK
jgi:excisionase family DNA binding protein